MPIIQADYKTTLSTNLSSTGYTFDVAIPPTLTEGCLVINRGQDTEEWVYMTSVSSDTVTVSHRGLSKTTGTLTEVSGNINQHFAGESIEWVNHPVHIINKRGDTVYGDLLFDGTKEIQFGTTATNIKDNAGSLELEDASGTVALTDIATTNTKLDDFATPDDNTDLDASTSAHGLMQKYPGGSATFLREDGTWATPSGAGNVSTSDVTATDNAIVRENGTSGTSVQKSDVVINDNGIITPLRPEQNSSEPSSPEIGQLYYDTLNNELKCYCSPKWDASNGFESNSKTYTPSYDRLEAMYIKEDGTKMYFLHDVINEIRQYTLSTPWDINTATYDSKSLVFTSQSSTGISLRFKPDGSKVYLLGKSERRVFEYDMGTNWSIDTATYSNQSVQSSSTNTVDFEIRPDGLMFWFLYNDGVIAQEGAMSTAWDFSTSSVATVNTYNFSIYSPEYPKKMFFNETGTKLVTMNSAGSSGKSNLVEFHLAIPWDITTLFQKNIINDVSTTDALDVFYLNKNGSGFFAGWNNSITSYRFTEYFHSL